MISGGAVYYSSSEIYDTVQLKRTNRIYHHPCFLVHFLGSMGSSAAATRRPSSANKLYVEHAFFVSMASICIPNSFIYPRILLGTSSILAPVPKIRISGFGTTTSNTSQCALVHSSHERLPPLPSPKPGTSHNSTFPSRNTTGPANRRPSASLIPAGPTESTWTGGGTSEASMFVRAVGRSGTCRGRVVWIERSVPWRWCSG